MSYAIRNDGQGWRAVNGPADVDQDETYSVSVPAPTQPTAAQVRIQYEVAAQHALDAIAQAWGYDDLRSAVSYIGSRVAQWDAEGKALRDYRDDFWTAAHAVEVSVANGASMPASVAEFVAMLPPAPVRPT